MSNGTSDETKESGENQAKPTITIAEKSGSSGAADAEKETITIAEKNKPKGA